MKNTNKFALYFLLVTSLVVYYAHSINKKMKSYKFQAFSEKEQAAIVGKGRLKHGMLPEKIDFIKFDPIFKEKLTILSEEGALRTVVSIVKLERLEQQKLENPGNPKILDEARESTNKILVCLASEADELRVALYYTRYSSSPKRKLALMNLDSYYKTKSPKLPQMKKEECDRLIGGQSELIKKIFFEKRKNRRSLIRAID